MAQAKVPASVAVVLTTARFDSTLETGRRSSMVLPLVLFLPGGWSREHWRKQFAEDFEQECSPFQYALSTRAGTDCVGHLLRAATDASPTTTVLSVDGIGAYDHVLRAAMLGRLECMPRAKAILPFVRLSYAQPFTYSWFNDEGERQSGHPSRGRRTG